MRALHLLVAAVVPIAGCGFAEPFEFRPDEFNRASPTFNIDPDPLTEVSFCYNRWQTSLEEITGMAEARCSSQGRQARFREFSYDLCPVATPVNAAFDCIAP